MDIGIETRRSFWVYIDWILGKDRVLVWHIKTRWPWLEREGNHKVQKVTISVFWQYRNIRSKEEEIKIL
jgi:hypothetical protein